MSGFIVEDGKQYRLKTFGQLKQELGVNSYGSIKHSVGVPEGMNKWFGTTIIAMNSCQQSSHEYWFKIKGDTERYWWSSDFIIKVTELGNVLE